MAFRTDQRLDTIITQALNDKEMASALSNVTIQRHFIVEKLKENSSDIWAFAIEDILNYDNLENDIENIKSQNPIYFSEEVRSKLKRQRFWWLFVSRSFFILLIALIIPAAIYKYSLVSWLDVYTTMKGLLVIKILVALTIITLVTSIIFRFRFKKQNRMWLHQTKQIEETTNIGILENRLKNENESINNSLVEKAIKPKIRTLINSLITPSYITRLDTIHAPGLSQVLDLSQTITTSAKSQLEFLFNNMSGGSIGISGPRGAGKSTLIQNYCGAQRTIESIKGKKILPIFTSSPVEYDTRDFILHLFSNTCNSLLKLEGVSNRNTSISEMQNFSAFQNSTLIRIIKTIRNFCFSFGIACLIFATFLLFIQTIDPSLTILKTFDLVPGPMAKWGFVLTTMSFFIHKSMGGSIPVFIRDFLRGSTLKNEAKRAYQDLKRRRLIDEKDMENYRKPIIELAEQSLQKIKFQQTFTTGWSGTLKLPVGLEGGISNAVTLAENQMTNPEIISEFTQLLNDISLEYQLIIGIDELDKIESDEQAQKFLNEIKAIFGIPRCFYLISISENAMSNFERRGLPFRDVFDSSFDIIVHVSYFNLAESTALLEKRVIGKPIPFFYLSYCLSGGLPRDLIRTFRQIVEIRTRKPEINSLTGICSELINSEVRSKMNAIGFAVNKLRHVAKSNELSSIIFDLQNGITNDITLANNLKALEEWGQELNLENTNDKERVQVEKLLAISQEIYGYLSLMELLLTFFNNNLKKEHITKAEENGDFIRLALARQALTTSPLITKNIIREFRVQHNMTLLN